MTFKALAIFAALCVVARAQGTENKLEVNNLFYQEQCGSDPNLIANPRICFKTALDINDEAIKGKGTYDGYSTTDGHGFSFMCASDYRRMYTKDYWISAIKPIDMEQNPDHCCVYSIRRVSDNKIMSSGFSCSGQNNKLHSFP